MKIPDEDIIVQKAINQLWACAQSITDAQDAVRYMLDNIIVASQWNDQDILSAWNEWNNHIAEHRKFVEDILGETKDFMEEDDFSWLDWDKKVDYFDTVCAAQKKLEKMEQQVSFYELLSKIEHIEQSIEFFSQNFNNNKDKILYRKHEGTLASRGLSVRKKQLWNTHNRLIYEIQNIIKFISKARLHTQFSSISAEKQREYQIKQRQYEKQLQKIKWT